MRLYGYDFDLADGWVPLVDARLPIEAAMTLTLPKADTTSIRWDMGGPDAAPSITVTFDLGRRLPLEGLAVVVQALNTGFIYVAGWPSQGQTCVPTPIAGRGSPAVAIGTVYCVAFGPTLLAA